MWKFPVVLFTGMTAVVIAALWDTPEGNTLRLHTTNAYEYIENKIEANPNNAIGIITQVIIGLFWLVMVLLLRKKSVSHLDYEAFKKDNPNKENVVEIILGNNVEYSVADRAAARMLFDRLKQDLAIVEGRQKWMPSAINEASENLIRAKEAERLGASELVRREATRKGCEETLDRLTKESEVGNTEIRKINEELNKLKEHI